MEAHRFATLWTITAALVGSLQDTTSKEFPAVRPIRGPLTVWKSGTGKTQAVEKETRAAPTDRVGAAGGATALFATEGDTLVTVVGVKAGPDEGLTLERAPKGILIKVLRGNIVVESRQMEVAVKTADGVVEGKGMHLIVQAKEGSTRVVVLDGSVKLSTDLGSTSVEAGHESTARTGKKPDEPRRADTAAALRGLTSFSDQHNLAVNPGFEDGLEKWEVSDYEGKKRVFLEERPEFVHSGRRSARIAFTSDVYGPGPRNSTLAGLVATARLKAGKRYFARAYVRLEKKRGDASVWLGTSGPGEGGDSTSLAGRWVMMRYFFTGGQDLFRLGLEAASKDAAYDVDIYVDDVFLTEVAEPR